MRLLWVSHCRYLLCLLQLSIELYLIVFALPSTSGKGMHERICVTSCIIHEISHAFLLLFLRPLAHASQNVSQFTTPTVHLILLSPIISLLSGLLSSLRLYLKISDIIKLQFRSSFFMKDHHITWCHIHVVVVFGKSIMSSIGLWLWSKRECIVLSQTLTVRSIQTCQEKL